MLGRVARKVLGSAIHEIDLSKKHDWDARDFEQLARTLALCDRLQTLRLNSTRMGDEGLVAFCSELKRSTLPSLVELDLNDNQLGDEGAEALAEALNAGKLPKLKTLLIGAGRSKANFNANLGRACRARTPHIKRY